LPHRIDTCWRDPTVAAWDVVAVNPAAIPDELVVKPDDVRA